MSCAHVVHITTKKGISRRGKDELQNENDKYYIFTHFIYENDTCKPCETTDFIVKYETFRRINYFVTVVVVVAQAP